MKLQWKTSVKRLGICILTFAILFSSYSSRAFAETTPTAEPTATAAPSSTPTETPTPSCTATPLPTQTAFAGISGLDVRRGTLVPGTTTDYVITIDVGQTTTAFAPICVSSSATYTLLSGNAEVVSGGPGYGLYMRVAAADVVTEDQTITFKVTDTVGSVTDEKTYTVLVKGAAYSSEISGYTIRRGTLKDSAVIMDAGQTSLAISPNMVSPTAQYTVTVEGVLKETVNGADGRQYVQVNMEDVSAGNVDVVFTVSDFFGSQTYSLTVNPWLEVKRGTVALGTTTDYVVTLNAGATSTAFAPPIFLSPNTTTYALLSSNAEIVSDGTGYEFMRVYAADVASQDQTITFRVTEMVNSVSVDNTYTVLVKKAN